LFELFGLDVDNLTHHDDEGFRRWCFVTAVRGGVGAEIEPHRRVLWIVPTLHNR